MEVNSIGSPFNKTQRFILGSVLLILVDLFWVSSSELTKFVYVNEAFEKPFFCTYIKTSMFTIYLLGFLFWPPWRENFNRPIVTYSFLDEDTDDEGYAGEMSRSLSNPIFVPVKTPDQDLLDHNSGTESDDSSIRSVRFNKLAEVRQMSESEAAEALLARLSYQATLRVGELAQKASIKLSNLQIARVAFIFCLLWFISNYFHQVALSKTKTGLVYVLSSTSSLFTLFLASVFPANSADRMSISKLLAVALNIIGIAMINYSDVSLDGEIPLVAVLSLFSSIFYACYLVYIKKKVDNEERMDIPLFFGFVGLFSLILLWPLFFFLHFSGLEKFDLPTKDQIIFLLLNGFFGTVISEVIWLWGCFYTSSLIATMAISLTIPMTLLMDIFLKKIADPSLFVAGTFPIFLSFLAVIVLSHYENWDPVFSALRFVYLTVCRRTRFIRFRFSESPSEQTESLIGINSNEHEA